MAFWFPKLVLALGAAAVLSGPGSAAAESRVPLPCTCDDDCSFYGMPYCSNNWGWGTWCDWSGPGIPCDAGPPEAGPREAGPDIDAGAPQPDLDAGVPVPDVRDGFVPFEDWGWQPFDFGSAAEWGPPGYDLTHPAADAADPSGLANRGGCSAAGAPTGPGAGAILILALALGAALRRRQR